MWAGVRAGAGIFMTATLMNAWVLNSNTRTDENKEKMKRRLTYSMFGKATVRLSHVVIVLYVSGVVRGLIDKYHKYIAARRKAPMTLFNFISFDVARRETNASDTDSTTVGSPASSRQDGDDDDVTDCPDAGDDAMSQEMQHHMDENGASKHKPDASAADPDVTSRGQSSPDYKAKTP